MLQLEPENRGKPTHPDIIINPDNWGSNTIPQASKKDGEWHYNYPAALLEGGNLLPTDEQWSEMLDGKDIDIFIKENNIPPSGHRSTSGSYYDRAVTAYLWSSTALDGSSAWRRYFGYTMPCVSRGTDTKASGFSLRCLKDSSVSSSLGLFDEVIAKLQEKKENNEIENKKIDEVISLLRNLK